MTTPRPASSDGEFRLLFVCTANKCRSPIAEYLLRDTLVKTYGRAADSWLIGSAGVQTGGGRPMDPKAEAVLKDRGIDASGFRNRRLTAELAQTSDLILTATREHRGQVALLAPGVLGRIFTIHQFGYLLSAKSAAATSGDDLAAAGLGLISAAGIARSQLPARTADDDLADPVTRPMKEFRRCADSLQVTVNAIVNALRTG